MQLLCSRVTGKVQRQSELRSLWRLPAPRNCRVGGGAREYPRAGLRPPLELHVQFSRMQLWQRLSDAGMQEKELNQSAAQARTHRIAQAQGAASSPHCASACTGATRFVAESSRRDVGRAFGRGHVCNTRPNLVRAGSVPQSAPWCSEVWSVWSVAVPGP